MLILTYLYKFLLHLNFLLNPDNNKSLIYSIFYNKKTLYTKILAAKIQLSD